MSKQTKDMMVKVIFALVSMLSSFIVTYLKSIDENQRLMTAELSAIKQTLKMQESLPEQMLETRRAVFRLESEVQAAQRELEKVKGEKNVK